MLFCSSVSFFLVLLSTCGDSLVVVNQKPPYGRVAVRVHAKQSLADELSREVSRRDIQLLPNFGPSPLLPPDKVLQTVLEGLRRPDIPEADYGLGVAFQFSEPDPLDPNKRSSWAFGELRGRCNWAARGLPILDRAVLEDEEEEECDVDTDQLFLDAEEHAGHIKAFFSNLLHHDKVDVVGSPRWGADNLVEFDLVVKTDNAAPGGPLRLRARILLHRAGPLDDIWYIRGCTMLCEEPSLSS